MTSEALPISAVVATRDRAVSFRTTLANLAQQESQPVEIIVVDASKDQETKTICEQGVAGLESQIFWVEASQGGAAAQRNEGMKMCRQNLIWFFDDDIRFQEQCVTRLWSAIQSDPKIGGVNAMIVNQRYENPGRISRWMFRLLSGETRDSYAGRVIGPGVNLLPEDRAELPEVVPVEWLNTTCTVYRREALPDPPFEPSFTGYSLMEDVALSVGVTQRGWKLVNARTARIQHDSQSGEHKADVAAVSEMESTNRRYLMTNVLHRDTMVDHLKLALWEVFSIASIARDRTGRRQIVAVARGKFNALRKAITKKRGR